MINQPEENDDRKRFPGNKRDKKPKYSLEEHEVSGAPTTLLNKIISEWLGEYKYKDGYVELHGAPDPSYEWSADERERWLDFRNERRIWRLVKKLGGEEAGSSLIQASKVGMNLKRALIERAAVKALEDGVEIDETEEDEDD